MRSLPWKSPNSPQWFIVSDAIKLHASLPIIGAALAEQQTAPELLAALRPYVITSRRQMLRSIVQEAQARGELALQADTDLAVAQLIGSYYALAIAGEPMPPDWPKRVVDQVLAGIAARQPTQ